MTDTGIVNFVHPHPPHCLYYTISRYSGAESPCFHICMSLWNWRSVVVWVWKSFEKYLEEQGTHKSVAVCRKIHIFLPFEQITMLNLTCHLGAICTSGMIGKLFTPTFYAYITYIYLTQFTKYTDTNGISSQFKCANLCALHMHSTLRFWTISIWCISSPDFSEIFCTYSKFQQLCSLIYIFTRIKMAIIICNSRMARN